LVTFFGAAGAMIGAASMAREARVGPATRPSTGARQAPKPVSNGFARWSPA
jgi:hypothetical protein